MLYKALITGSEDHEKEVAKLLERLRKVDLAPLPYRYLPLHTKERRLLAPVRKMQLKALITISDYLVTFDKQAGNLEVRYAVELGTKVILVSGPPYRHYCFDYSDTYSDPEEKFEWMRQEEIIELLLGE